MIINGSFLYKNINEQQNTYFKIHTSYSHANMFQDYMCMKNNIFEFLEDFEKSISFFILYTFSIKIKIIIYYINPLNPRSI